MGSETVCHWLDVMHLPASMLQDNHVEPQN